MSIFNFGNRQRMHTQLVGNTSGREMFKVDEYNERKKTSIGLTLFLLFMSTTFYFTFFSIPMKFRLFLILLTLGAGVFLYFNYKQQRRLREDLY